MNDNDLFIKCAGMSDLFRLASVAMRYPDNELLSGIADGSFASVLTDCLMAVCMEDDTAWRVAQQIEEQGIRSVPSMKNLRIEYTRLFLSPKNELVYLYESRFEQAEEKNDDYLMFVNTCCMNIEKTMKASGFALAKDNKEPADHIANELEYLGLLFAKIAQALSTGDNDCFKKRMSQAADFWDEHFSVWATRFFELLHCEAQLAFYGDLVQLLALCIEPCYKQVQECLDAADYSTAASK